VTDALARVETQAHEVAALRARLRAETATLRRLILAADQAGATHDALVEHANGGLSRKLVYALFSDDQPTRERERFA
jgi:hypothetical protein